MCVGMREMMWEIFRQTGHIEAYLYYRQCTGCCEEQESPDAPNNKSVIN